MKTIVDTVSSAFTWLLNKKLVGKVGTYIARKCVLNTEQLLNSEHVLNIEHCLTEGKCTIVNIMTVIVIYPCTIYAGAHTRGHEI